MAALADRPSRLTPFVGRDREMALVESVWGRAVGERRPHLITVLGPPGIGKSRLTREISSLVEAGGGRVIRGRCYPYETRDAYGAFAQQVKQAAGIFDHDAPEVAREKIATLAVSLLPEQERSDCVRSLSLMLGLGLDEHVIEQVVLFYSGRRFVERLALDQPTLFVFEDVHWADKAQLDLLEYLAFHIRDTSAVFLALARPEFLDTRPTWGGRLAAQTMLALEPLSAEDASVITSHLMGDGNGSGSAASRVVQVAEGNPLFLEELASAVSEGVDAPDELPTTVRAAIASRIDALPPPARSVLLEASVIGKTFWRGGLLALGTLKGAEVGLDEALDDLESRNLIRREPVSQVQGDVEFSFRHILIRDVAYSTLPRAARRERHAAVARYIEEDPEQARELAWLLAHHWREANEPARAIDYLLVAMERARAAWATDEVAELSAAALALGEDDETRKRIRLLRGLALVSLEDYQRAATELGELIPELEGTNRLEALLARGRAVLWTEQTDETFAVAREAIELAERLDAKEFLAPAMSRLAGAHGMRGEEGDLDLAIELGERAQSIWIPGARTKDLAEHHHLMADANYWTGRYERALEDAKLQVQLSTTDPGSIEFLLRGGGMQGLTLTALGRYEEAFALFDAKIALGRELGRAVGTLMNYSTMTFRDVFDLAEARRRSEEALGQAGGWSGFVMPRLNSLVDILFADLAAGDVGKAEAEWPSTWDEVRQGKGWERWLLYGKVVLARAQLALHLGDLDEAADWASKAIDAAVRTRRRKYETASRAVLGQVLMGTGRNEDAIDEIRKAVAIADALGSPPGRWESRAAFGKALYATGDDDGAAEAYRDAAGIIGAMGATLSPEHEKTFLAAPAVQEVLKAAT